MPLSAHALDVVFGNEDVGVSATVASLPSIDDGGGSGGGAIRSAVRFDGLAYPGATVTLIRGSVTVSTVIADSLGRFSFLYTDVKDEERLFFTMYATDVQGRRSTLLNFPVAVYTGALTDIGGIRFAPTVTTDKVSIAKGDFINILGSSLPSKEISLIFEGGAGRVFSAFSDEKGFYRLVTPLSLSEGQYLLRAKYMDDTRTSAVLRIIVGPASIPRDDITTNIPGDCNLDQKVTLVDFSVLAFWFGKRNPPQCVDTNKDGLINLVDFSILAFYWRG